MKDFNLALQKSKLLLFLIKSGIEFHKIGLLYNKLCLCCLVLGIAIFRCLL